MNKVRILHVDDEADIREVVAISLSLDPIFALRSCSSGKDALAIAEAWRPDVVLLDVMMPTMDGPATLARLRDRPATSEIPVVFMTARAQSSELQLLKSLGAAGVIPKPFDPMTLAASVRAHISGAARIDTMREEFLQRFENDLVKLSKHWRQAQTSAPARRTLTAMKSLAHSLAGAGGLFGFGAISEAATRLEDAMIAKQNGSGTLTDIAAAVMRLQALRGKPSDADKKMEFAGD